MPRLAKNTLPMAALLTVLTSAQGLLTTASKTNGSYSYNFATVPFLAEAVKLLISWNLLARQRRERPEEARVTRDWRTVAKFPVPSLIYMVHNNVQVGAGGVRTPGGGQAGGAAGAKRCRCTTGCMLLCVTTGDELLPISDFVAAPTREASTSHAHRPSTLPATTCRT